MRLHDSATVEAVPHQEFGGHVAPGFEQVPRDRARARGSLRWGGGDVRAIATAYGAFAAAGGPLGLRNASNTVLSRKDGVRLPEQCTR